MDGVLPLRLPDGLKEQPPRLIVEFGFVFSLLQRLQRLFHLLKTFLNVLTADLL